MSERWRPIPGFEGSYEASDLGRVRSLDRITDRGRRWRGKTLTPAVMKNGYRTVNLWKDGAQRTWLVHRLVLMAFVGKAPEGTEALHHDSDKSNNRISNLSWGTHSENEFDKVRHGTHRNASKTCCPQGHPYDDENTYFYPTTNHRCCRECRRIYSANYYKKTHTKKAA